MKHTSAFRALPSVESLVETALSRWGSEAPPRFLVVKEAQALLDEQRATIKESGTSPMEQTLADQLLTRCAQYQSEKLQTVINATGILVHTNLGRAPLSEALLRAITSLSAGYVNLEYDIKSGQRGKRAGYAERLLAQVTQTEQVAIANNCASALVLITNTLANRREIVISRSELVQIGGEFRIPEMLVRAGGKLREIGTTNITTISDYATAITPKTGLILKVHQSNFVQKGFQSSVSISELSALARDRGIPLVYDLGSGLLDNRLHPVLNDEPTVHHAMQSGASLVCFSGDKLLGGPQAGIIAGNSRLVEQIRKNPLFRAFRVDKFTLLLLEQLALIYLEKRETELPVWRMLSIKESDLYTRARRLLARLSHVKNLSVESSQAQLGGGALPEKNIPSVSLCIRNRKNQSLLAELRRQSPPIVGRIEDGAVYLDLRTVDPQHDDYLYNVLSSLLAPS